MRVHRSLTVSRSLGLGQGSRPHKEYVQRLPPQHNKDETGNISLCYKQMHLTPSSCFLQLLIQPIECRCPHGGGAHMAHPLFHNEVHGILCTRCGICLHGCLHGGVDALRGTTVERIAKACWSSLAVPSEHSALRGREHVALSGRLLLTSMTQRGSACPHTTRRGLGAIMGREAGAS